MLKERYDITPLVHISCRDATSSACKVSCSDGALEHAHVLPLTATPRAWEITPAPLQSTM
jgi:hypothetical protein